jgi:hypothetical protein
MRRTSRKGQGEDAGWIFIVAAGLAYLVTREPAPVLPPQPEYIGLSTEMLNYIVAAQEQDMWCWAASVQTILGSYGIPIGQEEIVARVYGSPINEPGTDFAISASLNGWGFDWRGRRVLVYSRVASGPPPLAVLVRELLQAHPVLVTFDPGSPIGHAVVITSVSLLGLAITSLVCRDPWPSMENRAKHGRSEHYGADVTRFLSSIQSHWLISVSLT